MPRQPTLPWQGVPGAESLLIEISHTEISMKELVSYFLPQAEGDKQSPCAGGAGGGEDGDRVGSGSGRRGGSGWGPGCRAYTLAVLADIGVAVPCRACGGLPKRRPARRHRRGLGGLAGHRG